MRISRASLCVRGSEEDVDPLTKSENEGPVLRRSEKVVDGLCGFDEVCVGGPAAVAKERMEMFLCASATRDRRRGSGLAICVTSAMTVGMSLI